MNEAQIDNIVEQQRAADVDAEYGETITDTDYPEPEPRPRINPVIEFAVMLHDVMSYHMPDAVIAIGQSAYTKKPTVHVNREYFFRHLAPNWNVESKDVPAHGFVEHKIDFDLCDVFCIEEATFARVQQ